MSTQTPLAIPVPEDTDPLAAVYQYIRDLAEHIDEQYIAGPQEGPVVNSTALVTSPGYVFTAKAGKNYAFELHLVFHCASAAADARFAMTRTGLGDLTWSAVGTTPTAGGVGDVATGAVYHGNSGDTQARGVAAGDTGVHIYGTFNANAGVDADIALAWAQNAATANGLYLRDGSYMKVKVIP